MKKVLLLLSLTFLFACGTSVEEVVVEDVIDSTEVVIEPVVEQVVAVDSAVVLDVK